MKDDILDEALGLSDAAQEAFRAALQELNGGGSSAGGGGGGNWQETAAYAAEKAREQLEAMLQASSEGQ